MTTHNPQHATPCAWRGRFDALVQQRMATPFAWGVHDCCLWAADCVLATTGHDPAAPFRGRYSTAAGALALLDELGGLHAVGAMAGPQCPPRASAVGDVGLVQHAGRDLLAVCIGAGWLAPAAAGLALLPLEAATHAWRVQHG